MPQQKPPAKKVAKPAPKKAAKPKAPAKKAEKKVQPQKQKAKTAPKEVTSHENHEEHQETTIKEQSHAGHESDNMHVPGLKVDMKPGRTVRYDLYITDTTVNYTGKPADGYAINGRIPGPELIFTEGDTAEIYVHNRLRNDETAIHWHGVILPNRYDGVPHLTSVSIPPGGVHLYKFAIVQNGTYWYHSHSGLQEQAGLYGALIFRKREGQKQMTAMGATTHDSHQQDTSTAKAHTDHSNHDMHNMQEDKADTTNVQDHSGHNMQNMNTGSMNHGGHHMHVTAMPKRGNGSYNAEHTVILSEWTNEDPDQVQRRLRHANDWYAIKKGSTQSYSEAIREGHFTTKVVNEWKRMNAMDVSDVFYDRFLTNGSPETEAPHFKAGDRVRLRIVNAGASTYFWVQYAGGKMTVIGNDGNDVAPIEVDRLIIGVSETYDVVVTIPDNNSYEFRATPEDRTQATSLWLGRGERISAPKLPRLKYFEGMKMMNDMMKMNGDMRAMDMQMSLQQMDMNMVMYEEMNDPLRENHSGHNMDQMKPIDSTQAENMIDMQGSTADAEGIVTLNYAMLQSPERTILPEVQTTTLFFTLTGNMNRYVWSINNKVLKEWDKILIEKGHNVRIIMFNNSMMRHPMHLHGHDFRVINGQGEYAPFKNVLDIMPMETDTIEFAGSQTGDWFFHCHILYHMMAGMGNVFSYKNSPHNPEVHHGPKSYSMFVRHHQKFQPTAEIGLESNGSDGMLMFSGERYELRTEWRIGIKPEYGNEVETYFGRYFGQMQWFFPFIGFDYHKNTREDELSENAFGQESNQSNRKAFVAGFEYTLPMLLRAQARIDSKGKLRFQLGREDIPLTPRLRLSFVGNTDKEYMAGFRYILRKWVALSTHYDSDMGLGAGITITY